MKTLILHNNNLPIDVSSIGRDKEHYVLKAIKFESTALKEHCNFDDFISSELNDVFANPDKPNNVFDLIILPLSFDNMSQMMYTGLIVALHIRLTEKWNHTRKQILFFGSDSKEEIATISEYGEILFTPHVDLINKNLFETIKQHESQSADMSETQYKNFLNRIHISAPRYYKTHHSVANEWAYIRWCDMLMIPHKKMLIEDMLFYKFLRAKYGYLDDLKKYRKKHPGNPAIISGISHFKEKKTIVLIDDEWKNWIDVFNHIKEANKNYVNFIYCPIDKSIDKTNLIDSVNEFVKNNDADCYLLDLRLHDDDFREDEKLSGFDIIDCIREQNEANPIVVFSASNKIWNLEKAKNNTIGYVLKEDPQNIFNAEQSFKLYNDFKVLLKDAFYLSDAKPLARTVRNMEMLILEKKLSIRFDDLNNFINLTIMAKGKKNDETNSLFKSCLLILMTSLEEIIKERFEFKQDPQNLINYFVRINDENVKWDYAKYVFVKKETFGKNPPIIDSYCSNVEVEKNSIRSGFSCVNDKDNGLILSSLYLFYGLNSETINHIYLPVRNQRHKVAHTTENIPLTFGHLYKFFHNVLTPVIYKEIEIEST